MFSKEQVFYKQQQQKKEDEGAARVLLGKGARGGREGRREVAVAVVQDGVTPVTSPGYALQ